MIVADGPPLTPDQAARRAATGGDPIWISSPGGGNDDQSHVRIAFDAVAADPVVVVRGNSLAELETAWQEARRAWCHTGSAPGADLPIAVGWFSYDLARQWIRLPGPAESSQTWSPLEFRFFDAIWVRDNGAASARIFACDEAAARRLATRLGREAPLQQAPRFGPWQGVSAASDLDGVGDGVTRSAHAAAVGRIKDYLFAGDAYQVNLARQLTATISDGDPVWMPSALRARVPAPHAVWMAGRSAAAVSGAIDRYLVGNSPERFLRVGVDGTVETRPIKGTRPRGNDPSADAVARLALAASAKDRAEHVMIVDLERNDLGRICRTGSVVVAELLRIVELPTLFHLVSTVRGRLRADVGLSTLMEATFPGGSVTGAPKRRAMEIIEELEPVRRGVYTGATGWLGGAGDLDLAVAIRTATVEGGHLSLFVGGGIVADSDADSEWAETEVKARAFSDLRQGPTSTRG